MINSENSSIDELFTIDTIKNNIVLDNGAIGEEFIIILKVLGIDEFVSKLEMGYETVIELDGKNLSGGQCQKMISELCGDTGVILG